MNDVSQVAAVLRSQESRIRQEWRTRVTRDPELPTEHLTECELEDDIPNLLRRAAEALEEFAIWRDDAEARGELAGRGPPTVNHMRLRLREGYRPPQVVRELHHLRETIVEVCEDELCALRGDAARVVHASIDAAMMLAAGRR
jgi:hypothetical protein